MRWVAHPLVRAVVLAVWVFVGLTTKSTVLAFACGVLACVLVFELLDWWLGRKLVR